MAPDVDLALRLRFAPRHADGPLQQATKLAGTDFWRLRVGDLRVIYLVDDAASLVVVLSVARRSESTYRRTS